MGQTEPSPASQEMKEGDKMSEEVKNLNTDEIEEAAVGSDVKPYGDGLKKYIRHMVVKGDTLEDLAEKYSTTVKSIVTLNPVIRDRDLIRAGWVLTILCNDR